MEKAQGFQKLLEKFPPLEEGFATQLEARCDFTLLDKHAALTHHSAKGGRIYFLIQGSLIRNIVTSKGRLKTVMFHTESFMDFFKDCGFGLAHAEIRSEIVANEKSVVLSVDFDFLNNYLKTDLKLLEFYNQKTEKTLNELDLLRNFQLGLTSKEYLCYLQSNYGFLFLRFPAQHIASFMGITNVWLSKLMSQASF